MSLAASLSFGVCTRLHGGTQPFNQYLLPSVTFLTCPLALKLPRQLPTLLDTLFVFVGGGPLGRPLRSAVFCAPGCGFVLFPWRQQFTNAAKVNAHRLRSYDGH